MKRRKSLFIAVVREKERSARTITKIINLRDKSEIKHVYIQIFTNDYDYAFLLKLQARKKDPKRVRSIVKKNLAQKKIKLNKKLSIGQQTKFKSIFFPRHAERRD